MQLYILHLGLCASNHRVHVSTDSPQSHTIGHQESSLSLKHGLCVSASLNSRTTKDKARPLHLYFGAQCQAVGMG